MSAITTIKMGLLLARLKLGSIFTTDKTYPKDPNPENWRTVNGAKVHLNNGKIDGGAGGKFLSNAWVGKVKHGNNSFFPLSQMNYSAKAKTNAKSSQVTSQAGAAGANQAKQAAKTASQNKAASAVAEGQTSAIAAMQQYMEQKKKQPVAPPPQAPQKTATPKYLLRFFNGKYNGLRPDIQNAVNQSIKTAKKTGDYKQVFYALGEGLPLAQKTIEALKNKEITQKTAQNIIGSLAIGEKTIITDKLAKIWNVAAPSGNVSVESFILANPAPKPKTKASSQGLKLTKMTDSEIVSFVKKAAKARLPKGFPKKCPTQKMVSALKLNGKPKIVTTDELKKMAFKPGALILYRTVSGNGKLSADKIMENTKKADLFQTAVDGGGRAWGGGLYMAKDIDDSRGYGYVGANTMAAVVDPDKMRKVTRYELEKMAPQWIKEHPKAAKEMGIMYNSHNGEMWTDKSELSNSPYTNDAYSLLALAMGYNIIDHKTYGGYHTILDRSILITDQGNYYRKDFI